MPKTEGWAVYLMPMKGSPEPVRAICSQAEWEQLDRSKPGHFTLVQGNLPYEGEAERLARGKAGEALPRGDKGRVAAEAADRPEIATAGPAGPTSGPSA